MKNYIIFSLLFLVATFIYFFVSSKAEPEQIIAPITQEFSNPIVQATPTPSPTPEPPKYNQYQIALDVKPQIRIIKGVENLKYENKSYDTLDSIYFNVYINAFRKNANYEPYFNNFKEKIFSYGTDYSYINIISATVQGEDAVFSFDDTALCVELSQPLAPNDTIEITLQFEAYIPKIAHRTGANNVAMWCGNFIPTVAVYEDGEWRINEYYKAGDPFYSEVANYVVDITTPLGYTVAATGPFTIKETTEHKITSYSTKLVRDFAFAVSDSFKVTSYTNKNGTDINMYYYSNLSEKRIADLMKCADDSLDYYSNLIGTYPYLQLNIVECDLFFSGGMEYPAIIFMDSSYLKTDTLIRSLAHEIGHQWFYNIIGNNQITDSWIDEGMVSLVQEGIFYDEENLSLKMHSDYKMLEAKMPYKQNTNLNQSLSNFTSWQEYYDIGYTKAKLMFYSLKLKMGNERFSQFLKEYCARYSFKIIKKEDIIALAEEVYGDDLKGFFTSWLYENKLPPL